MPPRFRTDDYSLMHTDFVNRRVLSVNYWFTTPGWKSEFGGSFLWCAAHRDAVRLQPGWNQAVIFLPHADTWHAVEVVLNAGNSKMQGDHRFSYTTFVRVVNLDDTKHSAALIARQIIESKWLQETARAV